MQEYQSENITELAKYLLNVQRTVQPVTKDAENPFTKSWYASLNSVMDACRDALIENGIWLCQYPVPVEQPNAIGLVTKLTHAESGQWQSSLAVVPLPKADPQGMGSAMFTSVAFTNVLRNNGIRISMDGRGRWLDNVFIERLWRSLKYENVYLNAYETGSEAREGIGRWISFYNQTRPHSSLDGTTPERCYHQGLVKAA